MPGAAAINADRLAALNQTAALTAAPAYTLSSILLRDNGIVNLNYHSETADGGSDCYATLRVADGAGATLLSDPNDCNGFYLPSMLQ